MRFGNLVLFLYCYYNTDNVNRKMLLSMAEELKRSERSDIDIVTESQERDNICSTPGCIYIASRVLKNMNHNVEPCDDFYKFACGGFLNSTVIPNDKSEVTTVSIIADNIKKQLRTYFEEESHPNEQRTFKLVKDFYKACMNKPTIEEKRKLQLLLENLRGLGSWPVLDGERWNESDFTWENFVYRSRRLGYPIDSFIDISVEPDLKNSSRNLVHLDQAVLSFPHIILSQGFDNHVVQIYYKNMVNFIINLGANPNRANRELKESLEFEIQLAEIFLPDEERRNETLLYNPMTLNDLSAAYPNISWSEYLNTILAPRARLNQHEIVNVKIPSYLKNFEQLIAKTPKRVQANYAFWKATATLIILLEDDIQKKQIKFDLDGKTEMESKWEECMDIVFDKLEIGVASIYVRKYFKEDAKETVFKMINDIKLEVTKILKGLDWMDEKNRANALEKAAHMTSYIAYQDELLDDKKLEEFYEGLELSSNDYLGSYMNLTIFDTNFLFGTLRKPENRSDWINHKNPTTVGASYLVYGNKLAIPAGILQGAFFNNDRPRYMNYGGIGFVIGHEIIHGFDDVRNQFDKDGNLVDWWNSMTRKDYAKKAECIIHQYGNYTVKAIDMNLNGIKTQIENIADNGGIKAAYYAYKEWAKRNEPEQKLPGLPYNPKQMFWLSFANVWCSKYRPERMMTHITTSFHSLSEFRVRGSLSNMEEFSRDFNCAVGSNMNPPTKCAVW